MPKDSITSSNIEEYLEALYTLTRDGEAATTTEVSEHLEIAPASVTEMLKKLGEKGYVKHSPYKGTTLTDKGLRIAQKMTRKHRLLERFLHDVLKIGKNAVHRQACDMEHSLSDQAEASLCQFLRHPDRCPDDSKIIPACDLPFSSCQECLERQGKRMESIGRRDANLTSISELREHAAGKVALIRGDRKVLQRLLDMGLTPGANVTVVRSAPFNGPVEVTVRGSKLALGQDIASNVFIEPSKGEARGKRLG